VPLSSATATTLQAELRNAVRTLQRVVRRAAPGSVSGDEARGLVALFAEAERAASSGIAVFSPVVVETGSYAKAGHGTAAEWLGAVSGSSAAAAKGRLAAAERAAAQPALAEAVRASELSADQLQLVAQASTVAPGAAGTLLEMAEGGASHQELRDTATRLRAAARQHESERARRSRIHAIRHVRWHQEPGGGIRGAFFCDEVAWSRVAPRLEADAKERWKAAGAGAEPFEAYRLDAFLGLLAGSRSSSGSGTGSGSRPHAVVLIDAEALRRGTTRGAETCEIEGIGPVSVDAATELLGEGGLQYLVREGFDIRTVTKSTRHVSQCIDMALIARDRTCAVPGCGKRLGLQRDHCRVDFGDDGPTELENLVRLCPEHHALKTYGGWRIEGGPGKWRWIAPKDPISAGAIARARRLAAAKAKASASRNRPRRT
jgi:hypothetical protein